VSGTFMFEMHEAERTRRKARMALFGPSSSGKTYTAFILARALCKAIGMPDAPFVLIDTEKGRGELYADHEAFGKFQVVPVEAPFSPEHYIAAIKFAERKVAERDLAPVFVIDSISHEWNAEGGVQQIVDEAAARMGGNKWGAWGIATPRHTRFVETILQSDMHMICTMRSRTEWGKDEKNKPIKIGLGPVQRDELEYEFDLVLRMDMDHTAEVTKTYLEELPEGASFEKPGEELIVPIFNWLQRGEEAPAAADEPEKEAETITPEGEQATLEESGAAAADENGGEKIKGPTKGTITKLINDLDASYPDYERLTWDEEIDGEKKPVKHGWEALALARLPEWFSKEAIADLSEEDGQAMIERLRYTKKQLDEKAAAAEPQTL